MGKHFIVSQDLSIAEMPRWKDIDRTRFMWGNEVLHVELHSAKGYPERLMKNIHLRRYPHPCPVR